MEEDDEGKGGGGELSKKDKRALKKQKKLVAEYKVSVDNDQVKRPGELLDHPDSRKKLRIDPGAGNKVLSPEEFKELKKLLAQRKKELQQLPRFFLQSAGLSASLSTQHDLRDPIFMTDVQQLLLYGLGGNQMVYPPNRWCNLQKPNRLTHIVALVVDGVTTRDFVSYEHLFPNLTGHFPDRVEVMAPSYYKRTVADELSCIPISNAQKEQIINQYGSIKEAFCQKEIVKQFRALFPTEEMFKKPQDDSLPSGDTFSRTHLLLDLRQLAFESYPMPYWTQLTGSRCSDYKFTKTTYKEVTSNSPMFSVDCEMCMTASNPSELTHVAVVNEKLEVVYETYVKPKEKITNYLTQFSGITKEKLEGVKTCLEDVQEELKKLLPEDAILIGQSLNSDLHALKMFHPYVIDTSVIFNLSGITGKKTKLSALAEAFLGEDIQSSKQGHNPVEDAKAAMKLTKLKLSKGLRFGDNSEGILATSIINKAYKLDKTVAVIGDESNLQKYENPAVLQPNGTTFTTINVSKNKEVINKVTEVATSHQLTIAHIDLSKKLEKKKASKAEVFTKLDSWCDKVHNHVSINGMCVVVFSGPSNATAIDPQSQSQTLNNENNTVADNDTEEENKSSAASLSPNEDPDPVPNQQSKSRSSKRPRQNGVCFVKVNTRKV